MQEKYSCDICGNSDYEIYNVRERQFNRGEIFRYLYCNVCGTLQLIDKPNDISDYYSSDYYSFHLDQTETKGKRDNGKKKIAKKIIFGKTDIPYLGQAVLRYYMNSVMRLYRTGAKTTWRILDVGGGNGAWLADLKNMGYTDLTNLDRFSPDGGYEGIRFIHSDLLKYSTDDKYDLITLNHSFEHMENPFEVFEKLYEMLSDKGLLIIRIPVCGGDAWEDYKENWYEIDAPRHYYLYSEKSIRLLCEKNKFYVKRVIYDSTCNQFLYSKMYKETDCSYDEVKEAIGLTDKLKYIFRVNRLNRCGRGDRAAFYISKQHTL